MTEKPTLGDRPTYRQIQDYLGYLRDIEKHPDLQEFDLGQKKSVLKTKLDDIQKAENDEYLARFAELQDDDDIDDPIIESCSPKSCTPKIKCSVCGNRMSLDDNWYCCEVCPHKFFNG